MREREGRVLEGKSDVCWKEENGSAEILKGIGEGIDLCVLHVDEKKKARVALDGDGERVDGVFEGGGVELRFFQQENGGCDVGDHRNALQIAENKGKVLRVENSVRKRRREMKVLQERMLLHEAIVDENPSRCGERRVWWRRSGLCGLRKMMLRERRRRMSVWGRRWWRRMKRGLEDGLEGGLEGIEERENEFGEDLEIGFVLCHFVEIGKHALDGVAIRFDPVMKRAESVQRHRGLERALERRQNGGRLGDGDRRGRDVDLFLEEIDQLARIQWGDGEKNTRCVLERARKA